MSLNAAELQTSIDIMNMEIKKLNANNINIEDWDNVGDWALSEVEWDKNYDRIYFKTKKIRKEKADGQT